MNYEKHFNELRDCLKPNCDRTYADTVHRLRQAQSIFQHIVCEQLAKPFNDTLASMEQDSIESKRELAKWANTELRSFGLSIKCPNSGEAAYLIAGPGHKPSVGRFLLIPYSDFVKRTFTANQLPQFELLGHGAGHDAPNLESWTNRLKSKKEKKQQRP